MKRIFALDWGHKGENEEWHDVLMNVWLAAAPKLKKGDTILVENPPTYKAKDWHEKGINILTCHTMASKEHRDEMGFPRLHYYKNDGHRVDALVISDLYQKKPNLFYAWKPNEIKLLYSTFIQIQKTRVAASLREWSIEAKKNGNKTIDFLKSSEQECVKAMNGFGNDNVVYGYTQSIMQIGPKTGGGLVGLADATKFETASKLRRYAGLSVIDNRIQKFRAGESGGYSPDLKALLIKRIGDGIIKSSGTEHMSGYFMDYMTEKEKQQARKPQEIPIDDERNIVGDKLAEDIPGFKKDKILHKDTYAKLKKELEKLGKKTVLIKLSDGHIHNRSIRKAVQLLLEDYWVISRQLQGFPTVPPYATSVAKHVHYRRPRYIPEILEPFDPMRETGWIFNEGLKPWSQACEYIKDKCNGKPHE